MVLFVLLRYANNFSEPGNLDRVVVIVVEDSDLKSEAVRIRVSIISVNDIAPVVSKTSTHLPVFICFMNNLWLLRQTHRDHGLHILVQPGGCDNWG